MTEGEFVVLDELYFVQSYAELQESTALGKEELKKVLEGLLAKGWIRCLSSRSGEPTTTVAALPELFQNYFYLATKVGLLAHNSR